MKTSELKRGKIQRKEHVPNDVRTAGRDAAAEYIEAEIIARDRWPMELVDIADECDWSRQHIANVLEWYFEPVDAVREDRNGGRLDREMLDILLEVHRQGYREGWRDAMREHQQQPTTEKPIEERLRELFPES